MTLRELIKLLNKIKKCHPEALDADIWAVSDYDTNETFPISFVGYDKRHKPARVKLEY